MKKDIVFALLVSLALTSCGNKPILSENSLKGAIGDKFLIGAAVNTVQVGGRDTIAVNLVKRHFNSVVAENCMKSAEIHPEENRYNFKQADAFVQFGEENGMFIVGHCLIWHSQLPKWFCADEKGQNVSPEVLKQRMKSHIQTIVGRYKGRVKGWDVVNEAIEDNGAYRTSKFYEILGEEYIPLAFQYAYEADPKAEFYYNDYSMNMPGRRNTVVKMVKDLKAKGLKVNAIGMQGHMGMDFPDMKQFEESILAFASTGAKVMITEWDMSALPSPKWSANIVDTVVSQKRLNPYTEALPDSVSQKWNARMADFMQLFMKHADAISRVTVWGVDDKTSWRNNFPVKGRTDYPVLFDRNYQPKAFVKELLKKE